jgi:hypothetical protein
MAQAQPQGRGPASLRQLDDEARRPCNVAAGAHKAKATDAGFHLLLIFPQ